MVLILLFGLIGLWIGGVRGLLIGGALGFLAHRLFRAAILRGLRMVQSQFVESTFSVAGAISKADGVVTPDEIQVAEDLFVRLRLSEDQIRAAKSAFGRGKAADFDLDAEVDKFAQVARHSRTLLDLFLQVQVVAAVADGEVHPAEHEMLVRVARRLGFSERDVAQLEALLRAAEGAAAASGGPPPKQRLEDAYTALGVTSEASETEIKRAYRKLMTEHHPDKLASKRLPESMRGLAEERAREINAAYDLIKKARNFS